ncbi:plasmid replication initiator RepA [Pantoea ananatis]|uniref:plasmid replication initiator RepA n=1 Tax=Pantoea ananas TaxID=553 RepID=UPI0021F79075|nr:plasmid replication initiator RepA [Pantoea ananatis]MCW0350740.1 hypothetical protein [Pantoea ananatis]
MNDQILIGLNCPTPKEDRRRRGDHSALCKCPEPHFEPAPNLVRPRFCRQLMKRARDLTSGCRFSLILYRMKWQGKRERKPKSDRLRAVFVLLQGLCFYYDPRTNIVQRSLTGLAMDCGLATESENGVISISRASRALYSLEYEFEYIVRGTGDDGDFRIFFTPALFQALRIRPDHLRAARRKCERSVQKRGTLQ